MKSVLKYLTISFTSFTFAFTFLLAMGSLESQAAVQVHQEAPNFKVKDTLGNQHQLSKFQGKYVVLEWTNHQCPYVKKHYDSNNMQKLQKKYTDQGVIWLTIISSAPGKQGYLSDQQANQIAKEKGASPTAIIRDESGEIGQLYGAKVTPHMYIINPEGKLAYRGAIDSIPSADSKDIAQATNYVEAAFNRLMDGKAVVEAVTVPYGCSVKY